MSRGPGFGADQQPILTLITGRLADEFGQAGVVPEQQDVREWIAALRLEGDELAKIIRKMCLGNPGWYKVITRHVRNELARRE
jgi:hypothetical protein